jgi:hypothetical protein
MHRHIHLLAIIGFVALVTGCSPAEEAKVEANTQPPAHLPVHPPVGATLEVAMLMYQQSQDLGFAWRATVESIEAAKAAQQAGDTEAAQLQINRAIALAEASIAQAQREAVDWKTRPPFGQ